MIHGHMAHQQWAVCCVQPYLHQYDCVLGVLWLVNKYVLHQSAAGLLMGL